MSEFGAFMRGRLAEVIVLTVASAALFSTVTYGFHVEDSLRGAYAALVLLPLLLTLYLAAISYSPKTVVVGSIALVVAFGVVAVAMSAFSGHAFFYDEYGNVGFFVMLGTVVTVLGYVMTRRKALAYLYAVGGCFACGLVQFLYRNGLVVQLLLFILAAGVLCVVCANRAESRRIATDAVPVRQYLACGAGIVGISLLAACAVFALVVFPLNPPAQELKLITKYYSLETVPVRGEQAVEHKENDELVSQNEVEGDKQTNLENDSTEEVTGDQSDDSSVGNEGEGVFGSQGFNISGFGEETTASDYFNELARWLFVVPLVLLVLAAVILAKVLLRRHRLKTIAALPVRERVQAFYHFFDRRLPTLGVPRDTTATPLEHAQASANTVSLLEQGAQEATFLQLAQAYCSCVYGGATPSEADASCGARLAAVFYKNARRFAGRAKYGRLFFRL